MSNTTNLVLPFLAVGQAQKHVTVNESLRRLDAVIQLSVVSATTTAEPSSPADGEVWIIPSGKSGANWAAFANWSLGYYRDGAWEEIAPRDGWLAFVKDTDELLHFTGSTWSRFPAGKILTVSATDKLIGRSSSGAGAAEEIALTAAGRALIDDADAAAQRATLGLGTAATRNTGTSGATVPLLDAANTFSATQSISLTGARFVLNDTGGAGEAAFQFQSSGADRWLVGKGAATGGNDFEFYSYATGQTELRIADATGIAGFRLAPTVSGAPVYHAGASAVPAADNTHNLGSSSFRFAVVHAATGAINTSDAREKTELRALTEAERRAIRRVIAGIGVYQWLASVAAKGEASARLHCGVTAQAVADAFAAEGLDASRYGLFCADYVAPDDGEPRTRLGVRYDQLLAMALAALISSGA
jgi:hypothetical protein